MWRIEPRGKGIETRGAGEASVLLLLGLGALGRCASAPPPEPPSLQTEGVYASDSAEPVYYLLYRPEEYESKPGPWPLILFLHGAGERGDDLALVKREGLPRILERLRHFPFVVVSPQCRSGKSWSAGVLAELLAEVTRRYRADPRRVYVTGLSSGGFAALELAACDPGRIAAVAAVAPEGRPRELCRLKPVPVWVFHNSGDERIPARESKRLVKDLKACGGNARLTVYPQDGHDAWTDTYMREDLYDWFLAHRRPTP